LTVVASTHADQLQGARMNPGSFHSFNDTRRTILRLDMPPAKGELKLAQSDAAGEVSAGPASIAGRVTASHVQGVFGGKSDNGDSTKGQIFRLS
jgi:hypothetical protein